MEMSDELLMAFADGELGPAEAGLVSAAVAGDPVLAARVARFVQSRKAVAEAFRAATTASPPDPMIARIRALSASSDLKLNGDSETNVAAHNTVVAFPPRRQVPFWQLPLAASIALIAGLGAGQLLTPAPGTDGVADAILGDPGLSAALAVLPSGARETLDSGAQVALIATFENGDGELCREFEYDQPGGATTVAVACRTATDWNVHLAIAAGSSVNGYAPASSIDALDAWLMATGAAPPLSLEAELAALQAATPQ